MVDEEDELADDVLVLLEREGGEEVAGIGRDLGLSEGVLDRELVTVVEEGDVLVGDAAEAVDGLGGDAGLLEVVGGGLEAFVEPEGGRCRRHRGSPFSGCVAADEWRPGGGVRRRPRGARRCVGGDDSANGDGFHRRWEWGAKESVNGWDGVESGPVLAPCSEPLKTRGGR